MFVKEIIALSPSPPSQAAKLRGLRTHLDANIYMEDRLLSSCSSILVPMARAAFGRFLMNLMLASGGYNWAVIRWSGGKNT